jgi:hypothetical protein
MQKNPVLFATVVVFGILIGLTIDTGIKNGVNAVNKATEIYETLKYKTDAQEPVLKAMRLKDYRFQGDDLFVRFEVLKIRECGFPMSMNFTYVDFEGKVHKITDVEVLDLDGVPGIMQGPAKLNPTEWQSTDWFKLKSNVTNISLYLTLQHTCQVKFTSY